MTIVERQGAEALTASQFHSEALSAPAPAAVATTELAPPRVNGNTSAQPAIATATNVTVNVGGPQIIYQDKTGHNLFVRAIWFVCVGWWLGEIWLFTAWALNLTVIGLPLGLMMINKLPMIMTLKSQSSQLNMTVNADGSYVLTRRQVDQHPFWLRAIYFIFVGWWASLLWAEAAYLLGLLILPLPLSFVMFDRMPVVTTLRRY